MWICEMWKGIFKNNVTQFYNRPSNPSKVVSLSDFRGGEGLLLYSAGGFAVIQTYGLSQVVLYIVEHK